MTGARRLPPVRWRWLCLSLCAAPGCISYGSHLSAAPTPPSRMEYSASADVLVLDRGFGPQVLPNPEVALRRGLTRGFDLGLRLNALGAEASSRIALLDLEGYRLTAVPLLGGGFVPATNPDTELVTTTAGVIALSGFSVASRSELVFGLRGQTRLGLNAVAVGEDFSEASWSFVPGGSLGVRFPVTARLFLFPEVVVLVPYDLEQTTFDAPIVQGGIAIQWNSGGSSKGAQSPP